MAAQALVETSEQNSAKISVLSWNIWFDSATAVNRFPAIYSQIERLNADIVFLQEVTPQFIDLTRKARNQSQYQLLTSKNARRSYGQAFLTKTPLLLSTEYKLKSDFSRTALFAAKLINPGRCLVLINVHLESGIFAQEARRQQINHINKELLPKFKSVVLSENREISQFDVIWAGDFNTAYTELPYGINDFNDVAKIRGNNRPTYHIENNKLADYTAALFEDSARLDRIYISKKPQGFVIKEYRVFNSEPLSRLSDHYAILAVLEFTNSKKRSLLSSY